MFCVLKICVAFLLVLEYSPCSACGWAQYEKNGTCCTMCTPGYFVYTHCTRTESTVCVKCPNSTFTDKPHGDRRCSPCTACNEDSGLRTVKECTAFSDTVCGALEGNYCTDPYEGGCRAARKHTTCKPGQFIKHPGTDSNDTVCESCPENSFSSGLSTFCIPHTNCKAEKRPTIRPGDSVSDAECGDLSQIPIIFAVIAVVCYLAFLVYKVLKCKYEKTAPSLNVLFTPVENKILPTKVCIKQDSPRSPPFQYILVCPGKGTDTPGHRGTADEWPLLEGSSTESLCCLSLH